MDPQNNLHLPSLSVRGFRGFERLSIPRLGRVTLLAGRNGVGKTTVLEAVRLYAARGRWTVLRDLLSRREEFATGPDEDGVLMTLPDVSSLFHGREERPTTPIAIGAGSARDELQLEAAANPSEPDLFSDPSVDVGVQALKIRFGSRETYLSWPSADERYAIPRQRRFFEGIRRGRSEENDWPAAIPCKTLGPGIPSNDDLATLLDRVLLTDTEEASVQALQMALGPRIERVGAREQGRRKGPSGRYIVVKLKEHPQPVPLKSLGDGAVRLFGAALRLANSHGGLLVIDEAENGLHYTVHVDFWRMVLRAAHRGNVQVLATTHSWDCITGFARAATELDEADGVLVRLEPDDGVCRAVRYSRKDLETAAVQGIEVR